MVKLSQRLAAIACYTENSKSVADVGTDHGHIPVWLAQRGNVLRITASDIKKGPLDSARAYAVENGVADKIEFVLTDGLNGISSEHDTVIIAGMGGETIISILEAAPWTKNGVRLILQPQSKIDLLNEWLSRNGYRVDDGTLVKDAGKMYLVLSVSGGKSMPVSDIPAIINQVLVNKRDPLLAEYISDIIKKNENYIKGMEKGGYTDREEYAAAKELEAKLNTLLREAEQW